MFLFTLTFNVKFTLNIKSVILKICSLSILHSYCVLIKTHMGKSLFSPELKSYSITQWNSMTIGSCSGKKWTNGSAAELHKPMATIPARSRQNGQGIWLYKRSFRHRILRFLLLQRRRLRLHWPRSLLAVDTPRSWTQRPRSARLIRLFLRAPASQQFWSRSLPPSGDSHVSF